MTDAPTVQGLRRLADPRSDFARTEALVENVFVQEDARAFWFGDVFLSPHALLFVPYSAEVLEGEGAMDRQAWAILGFLAGGFVGAALGERWHAWRTDLVRRLRSAASEHRLKADRKRAAQAPLPADAIALLHGAGFWVQKRVIRLREVSEEHVSLAIVVPPGDLAAAPALETISKRQGGAETLLLNVFVTSGDESQTRALAGWVDGRAEPMGDVSAARLFQDPTWPSPRAYIEGLLPDGGGGAPSIRGFRDDPAFVTQLLTCLRCYGPDERVAVLAGLRREDSESFARFERLVTAHAKADWWSSGLCGVLVLAGLVTLIAMTVETPFWLFTLGLAVMAVGGAYWWVRLQLARRERSRYLNGLDDTTRLLGRGIPEDLVQSLGEDLARARAAE